MKSVQLSQSITAAMQLRLPGTAGRVAHKMRYIDEVAPRFRAGGLIRDVPETRFDRLWAVGVASVSNSIPAFGGVLYGAAALRQDVNLVEGTEGKPPTATPSYQDSEVDVADMTFVQTSNRLIWKEYRLAYSLLETLFEQGAGLGGGEGLGLVVGGRLRAGSVGGGVGVVEVGLDGVGVEGGDGGQVKLDRGRGEPAPAQVGGPAGHVGGRDDPGGLIGEAGKVVQGTAVGAAGVGGAGGLEPAVGGVGPVGLSVV
jgi:hypothetical protein